MLEVNKVFEHSPPKSYNFNFIQVATINYYNKIKKFPEEDYETSC